MKSCACSSGVYQRLLIQPQAPLASPTVRTPARYQSCSLKCLETDLYMACCTITQFQVSENVSSCMVSTYNLDQPVYGAVSMPVITRAVVQMTPHIGNKWDYTYTTYQNLPVLRHQGLNTSGIDGAHSADPEHGMRRTLQQNATPLGSSRTLQEMASLFLHFHAYHTFH